MKRPAKKQTFYVPVYYKVRAKNYIEAEQLTSQAVQYGMTETVASKPPKNVKGWAFDLESLQ
ncbi:MAG: hypothetical protein MOGMAGMI_02641 [Candidatus Omnitrophica bacterium]|nr:hypothetical protein [Candidatus Omnitrophota bacterium]